MMWIVLFTVIVILWCWFTIEPKVEVEIPTDPRLCEIRKELIAKVGIQEELKSMARCYHCKRYIEDWELDEDYNIITTGTHRCANTGFNVRGHYRCDDIEVSEGEELLSIYIEQIYNKEKELMSDARISIGI